jgi:hypothetical protein
MRYPAFFDAVPPIVVRDPLAEFLGAIEDGIVEYRYVDAVKLAGHSCPTVASAWTLTRRALAALYGDRIPERGAVRIEMRGDRSAGVAGVIAGVASLVTGASGETGFKGIAGRFDRRERLFFAADVPMDVRFTRIDSGAAVDAAADLKRVASDAAMPPLLQKCAAGTATRDEAERFGRLWQDRVRRLLLEHADDNDVFVVRPA